MENKLDLGPCSLVIEHKQNYLHAIASGKRENDSCTQIWRAILSECKSINCNKILYERKLEGIGTVTELREMILDLSDLIEDEYIAFVDDTEEHFQTNRLAEMVASNLNLNVKFCTSLGEAKEWLLLK